MNVFDNNNNNIMWKPEIKWYRYFSLLFKNCTEFKKEYVSVRFSFWILKVPSYSQVQCKSILRHLHLQELFQTEFNDYDTNK
jgi:hypothetical protein